MLAGAGGGQAVHLTDIIYIEAMSYLNPVTPVPPASWVFFDNAEFVNLVVPEVGALHSATADDGSFDTGLLGFHDIAAVFIERPQGTVISFHCRVHDPMHGAIVVV